MDDSFSPAAADPRAFLEQFAKRPGMWTGSATFTRVDAFLHGMLMTRDEWSEVQAWWEARHGRSPLGWTAQVCEAVTGKTSAGQVTEQEAPEAIRAVCAELGRFYIERIGTTV